MKPSMTFSNDALLTVEEMSKYLRISRIQAYELVKTSDIPNLKIGKQYRIPYWSLREWVAKQAGTNYTAATEPGVMRLSH